MPIVATISSRALTKLGIRILRLANACDYTHIDKRGIVKAVLQDELDLFLCRKRRQLFIDRDGAKVRDDEENPLRLLAGVERWVCSGWRRHGRRSRGLSGLRR